jgi:hypothetical protein
MLRQQLDFIVIEDCARKVIHSRKLLGNWESFRGIDVGQCICVVDGIETIWGEGGPTAGSFPTIPVRIAQFLGLKCRVR